MTNEILSTTAFHWVLIALTGGLAGSWLVCDAFDLVKLLRAGPGDALAGDKRFGCIIGMLIGLVSAIGCCIYYFESVA
jgi:hypothetical protein